MRQPPTLLGQQCWELLRPCWQWCANGCNNSQQCWNLQCIVGRMQPMRPCKLHLIRVRGLKNVGKAVQTDPTMLRYASAITNFKESLTGFKLCANTPVPKTRVRNNMQQGVQMDVTCNIHWPTMLRQFGTGLMNLWDSNWQLELSRLLLRFVFSTKEI